MSQETNTDSIDCATFESRIHQVLDDRLALTDDRPLMDHVAICPPCGVKLDDYELVDDSVKLLGSDIDRILSDVRNSNSPAKRLSWPVRIIAVVASLAAMIFVFSGVFNSSGDPSTSSPRTARLESSRLDSTIESVIPEYESSKMPVQSKVRHHVTPKSSPFSRDFEGYSFPNIAQLNASYMNPLGKFSSWDQISNPMDTVFQYSSELPGVRPMQCSLNVTFDLLKKSFSKPVTESKAKPDLGCYGDSAMLAAV